MNKRIRIGIIGSGEVAQVNHLPSLKQLEDLFEVTALSDVSVSVLQAVADLHRVPHRFTDYRELVAHPEVDAVVIASPNAYHTEQALAAMAAGKHVLVEKPMSMTLQEADQIIEAERKSQVTVQVGYMRRYAPAFVEAVKRVRELDGIRLARVHDVLGWNSLMVNPTSKVIRGEDVPEELKQDLETRTQAKLREAIGEASRELYQSYGLLLGLSTHDLSAMRELLGVPKRVLYATYKSGGLYISAAFDYGDYVCHFETGIDDIARFDCHLEVYGKAQTLRVEYNTPYVRHLPTKLLVTSAKPDSNLHLEAIQPAFADNFTQEWRAFHHNITTGTKPKTSPEDYRHDLELFQQMIAKMREAQKEAVAAD